MSTTSRVRTDPRISRRRRAVARSRRRAVFVRSAVVLALIAGTWGVFFSPLLAIDGVAVSGARHTRVADIEDIAGVDASDNLLLVSTGAIAERVERLPWVESVSVTRRLPGTIKVKIVERKAAVVLSMGAATWTLDESGRVLEAGAAAEGLAVLAGAEVGDVEAGAVISDPEVAAALKTWRALPTRLRDRVQAIFAPTEERLTLTFHDGTVVRYGAADRLRAKNRVLGAVLARLAAQGRTTAYIDVRVPTNPAVGPAVAVGSASSTSTDDGSGSEPAADPTPAEANEPADGYTP